MTERDIPVATYLVELNKAWFEVFGHSYTHCYQLSLLDGETGKTHQAHLAYVANYAVDKPEELDID